MTPRMAMPSAPPNSAAVSESADAAPARSGGADPTTRSVVRVSTGARPSENTTDPVTRRASPAVLPTRVNNPRPTAASVKLAAMTKAGRNRRASAGVSKDPATKPAEDGSIHRPAASGDRPSTSCRYWVMNSRVPNPTKKLSRLVVSAAVKAAERNSRRSSSGSASRCCRRTNAAPAASPATIDTAGSHPRPSWVSCLSPKMTASTAATDRAALSRSSLPAPGSRNSGSSSGPSTSSSAITGTASRNTDPHQNHSSSTPPSSGPIAPPTEKLVIHTEIATVRWRGSANMLRISDRVEGATVAPATPSRARAAISIAALVDQAARSEVAPNAAAPISLPGDHHVHELRPAVAGCWSAVGPGGARHRRYPDQVRFGLLGTVAVWADDGRLAEVPEAKVRALLADLLIHLGQPVPADRLIDDLWGDDLPVHPAGALQVKVSRLRQALENAEPGGG